MVPLEYGVKDGAVLLHGGAVHGVLDEEVGVRQRLDLLVVVEVGQDPDAQLLVLALHGAGEGLLEGRVHVASAAKMMVNERKRFITPRGFDLPGLLAGAVEEVDERLDELELLDL